MSTLVARISTTITSGQSVSSTVKLDGHVPSILEMSAAWDVAALFFQASSDDSNFYTLYDEDGLALVAAAGATSRITLPISLPRQSQEHQDRLRHSHHPRQPDRRQSLVCGDMGMMEVKK